MMKNRAARLAASSLLALALATGLAACDDEEGIEEDDSMQQLIETDRSAR